MNCFYRFSTHEVKRTLFKLLTLGIFLSFSKFKIQIIFRAKICNYLNCCYNWDDHISISFLFPQFKSIPFHVIANPLYGDRTQKRKLPDSFVCYRENMVQKLISFYQMFILVDKIIKHSLK